RIILSCLMACSAADSFIRASSSGPASSLRTFTTSPELAPHFAMMSFLRMSDLQSARNSGLERSGDVTPTAFDFGIRGPLCLWSGWACVRCLIAEELGEHLAEASAAEGREAGGAPDPLFEHAEALLVVGDVLLLPLHSVDFPADGQQFGIDVVQCHLHDGDGGVGTLGHHITRP